MAKLKSSPTTIYNIKLHNFDLQCQIDQHRHPMVTIGEKSYTTLYGLIKAVPILSEQKQIKNLSKIANFLCNGVEYLFIDDIPKYQEEYLNRVEFEQNTFDYLPNRIIDHGVFDVTGMHPPRIINDELVFYVKNDHTEVPYRVIIPYPIIKETLEARYELLPYA